MRMFVEFCGQNGSFLQHNYIMIAAHRVWLMAKHHTWPATSRSDPAADWSWKYVNWQNNGGNFASQQSTTKTWKCGSQHKSKIKVDYSAAASLFNFGMRLLVQSNNPPPKRLNSASLLFKENYMPRLTSDGFSSPGRGSKGMLSVIPRGESVV